MDLKILALYGLFPLQTKDRDTHACSITIFNGKFKKY